MLSLERASSYRTMRAKQCHENNSRAHGASYLVLLLPVPVTDSELLGKAGLFEGYLRVCRSLQ